MTVITSHTWPLSCTDTVHTTVRTEGHLEAQQRAVTSARYIFYWVATALLLITADHNLSWMQKVILIAAGVFPCALFAAVSVRIRQFLSEFYFALSVRGIYLRAVHWSLVALEVSAVVISARAIVNILTLP